MPPSARVLLFQELHGTFGLIAALAVAGAQQDPGGSFLPVRKLSHTLSGEGLLRFKKH